MLTDGHGRQRGEQEVVEHQVHLVDHHSSGKATVNLIPETDEHESLEKQIIHVFGFFNYCNNAEYHFMYKYQKQTSTKAWKNNHSCFRVF